MGKHKEKITDIALFLPSLRGGGAERVMLRLAKGFMKLGFTVDLVLVQREGEYIDQVPPMVRVVDLHSRRVIRSLPGLVRYLHQTRPKAMISAMTHTNVLAILATRIANTHTSLIVTEHNYFTASIKHRAHRRELILPFLVRILYPLAEHVVVISEEMKKDFQKYTSAQLKVIYNPVIDQDVFLRALDSHSLGCIETKLPFILGIGRLTEQKDFETLIGAFSIVRREHEVRLVIAGEGSDRDKLERLIFDLGLRKDVILPGFVENPYALMAKAAAFVLSSRWEGLPTVLIEALAVGVPIISTDCPSGPREVLRDGDFGLLVPVGDPEKMAAAIMTVLDTPERYGMTEERMEWVMQNFGVEQVVQKYLHVLGFNTRT